MKEKLMLALMLAETALLVILFGLIAGIICKVS